MFLSWFVFDKTKYVLSYGVGGSIDSLLNFETFRPRPSSLSTKYVRTKRLNMYLRLIMNVVVDYDWRCITR